jgi:hypothetical protein
VNNDGANERIKRWQAATEEEKGSPAEENGQNGLICEGRMGNKGGARACQYFEENGDVIEENDDVV